MFGLESISINLLSKTVLVNSLVLVLLILFSVYLYRKTNPPISKWMRILLGFLRIVAIVALFTSLFEPLVSYSQRFERQPKVSILLDESNSMDKVEAERTRKARRDSLLSSDSFAFLKDNSELKSYYFAESISDEKQELNREATSVGNALDNIETKELTEKPDFRILFTDGNSNTGKTSYAVAEISSTPVYTIDISMSTEHVDFGIDKVDFNPVMFAGEQSTISLNLKWSNAPSESVPIQLIDSGKVVAQSTLQVRQSDGLSTVKLDYTPTSPGQKILKVSIPQIGDEENISNNAESFSVKVLKSKLSVLILSESPDYEIGFIKRFLLSEEKYDIDLRILGNNSGNLKGSIPGRQAELNAFDLVILHDLSTDKLGGYEDLLNSFMAEKGGSVWYLMGELFSKSNINDKMKKLLPFYSSSPAAITYTQHHLEPVEKNIFHPALRIAESQSSIRTIWADLPPFETIVIADVTNPNAQILATASGGRLTNQKLPVLGFLRHGPGKLFATASNSFWKLGFVNLGFGESDIYYKRYLDGVISWLTVNDDLEPIRIYPEKDIFSRGENVLFKGVALDLGYRPIPDVSGVIEIENESGDSYQADLLLVSEDTYEASFKNINPGRYSYTGTFSKDSQKLKESTGSIIVNKFSLEEYDTSGNPEELKQIAALTNGKYYRFNQFSDFIENLNLVKIDETVFTEIKLWNKFWLLLIFIGALSAEWLLRKMNQLI
ncbi:MAG: hypothetical protein DWP97_11975 [Calditrichaeota bacterium]|nr:MAG: hypothetical protein DWP97_11975 [Calditrichota bacterium]